MATPFRTSIGVKMATTARELCREWPTGSTKMAPLPAAEGERSCRLRAAAISCQSD